MGSQNVYEYKKINQLDYSAGISGIGGNNHKIVDKLNEVIIEYNHIAKDFELYKNALRKIYTELEPEQKDGFTWTPENIENMEKWIVESDVIKKG